MDENKKNPLNSQGNEELDALSDFHSTPIEENQNTTTEPTQSNVEEIETKQTPSTIFLGENANPLTSEIVNLPKEENGTYSDPSPTHQEKVAAAEKLVDSLIEQDNQSEFSPDQQKVDEPIPPHGSSVSSFDSIESLKERIRQSSFGAGETQSTSSLPKKATPQKQQEPPEQSTTLLSSTSRQESSEEQQQGGQEKHYSQAHIPKGPAKKGVYLTKKAAAVGAAAIVLLAGGAGYLGNKLAGGGSGNPTVVYQDLSEKIKSLGADENGNLNTSQIAEKNLSSVVEIDLKSNNTSSLFGGSIRSGAGSGVIISEDGYIVTNAHVVSGANSITVRLRDGKEYSAKLIGSDTKTDIAVIKIDATKLTPAVLGNSDDLQVGEPAVAIGNPLGELGGTVTSGIISAVNREITVQGNTMSLIQTNASISPGNSGGGLFDSKGNLIGIVNAKSSGSGVEGLGFAIPINEAKEIFTKIIEKGYVDGRVQLGVKVMDISTPSQATEQGVEKTGVYIAEIIKGTGAASSDLAEGDCILALDDYLINNMSDLSDALENYKVGDTVTIKVLRDGKTITTSVKLTQQSNNG